MKPALPWDGDGKRLWSVADLIELKAFQLTDMFEQSKTSLTAYMALKTEKYSFTLSTRKRWVAFTYST